MNAASNHGSDPQRRGIARIRRVPAFLAALLPAILMSCARATVPKADPTLAAGDPGWTVRMMNKMSLEERIGQMILCPCSGKFVNGDDDSLRELETLIRTSHIGGLILFGGEPYETAFLLNHLQRMAKIPLLVASDLERGVGNQITGATLFPPLMALGASGSEDLAYDMGGITAIEGRALGIHMTFAPVVDVNVNPNNPIINTRSAGETPELVGRLAQAFIRGCQTYGMIATAKHFPGHGDTALDSHSQLPVIGGGAARLEDIELYPFKQAIAGGVQAVMTAHVSVPALDPTPGLPATLSPAIVTGLLRKKLGFQGLIVTDALNMEGLTGSCSNVEAVLKAVEAGADILLMPPDPAGALRALADAVRSGQISQGRIDESAERILEAKSRLGLQRDRFVSPQALNRSLSPKRFLERAKIAFENSATLVKNEESVLPLPRSGKTIAVFSLSSDPGDYFAGQSFVSEMKKRSSKVMGFFADGDTGQESLDEASLKAAGADVAVFALFSKLKAGKGSVDIEPKHAALVNAWAAGPACVIVVSFGSPYFLKHFPAVSAYLCLYRNTPQTQEIAARALFGEMDVSGRLPVTLPGLFPVGHGLELKKIKTSLESEN